MSMGFNHDNQKELQTPLMSQDTTAQAHGETQDNTPSTTTAPASLAVDPLASSSSSPSPSSVHDDNNNNNYNDNRRHERFLDRNAAFYQSRGHWGVQRQLHGTRLRGRSSTTTNTTTTETTAGPTGPSLISREANGSQRQHVSSGASSGGQRQQSARGSRNYDNNNNCTIQLRSILNYIWGDWFHSLAYRPTLQLLAIIFLSYAMLVFVFAYIYLGVSKLGTKMTTDGSPTDSFCRMDIENHMDALYFSLSTMTTIGYGASDYYFADCWTPLLLVLFQTCCSITFQSIAIGLLFQRISRGQKRSRTIVFSNMAVIRMVNAIPYLMIRIGELRRQHLIQIHVRCYCIKHERYPVGGRIHQHNVNHTGGDTGTPPQHIETAHFMTRHLKLHYPDESLGSQILMSVPQVIVHALDDTSPLVPSSKNNKSTNETVVWYDRHGYAHEHEKKNNNNNNDDTNNDTDNSNSTTASTSTTLDSLSMYVQDRDVEIVVQVEGVDELTGQALQARHSYRWNDLAWGYTFAPCILQPMHQQQQQHHEHRENDTENTHHRNRRSWWRSSCWRNGCNSYSCQRQPQEHPICLVDFGQFHTIVPINDDDGEECPYV